jgi:DNA-binding PadR family transcriptional regulator
MLFGSLKKAGLIVTSEKPEGSKERRYYLPAAK